MNISKIVRLGTAPAGYPAKPYSIFCKIEYKNGKLSINGVHGPTRDGNAHGSCGQINMSLSASDIAPAPDWTTESLTKFFEVWKRWHLNDMQAACEHQRALGWLNLAGTEVTLYHFQLNAETTKAQSAAKDAALAALVTGETFTPTPLQVQLANLPYWITQPTEALLGVRQDYYEPRQSSYGPGFMETKSLGWLTQKEHPDGILSRPCPVCNYKYGSAWLKEEVPADIVEWLASLPNTDIKPAWV